MLQPLGVMHAGGLTRVVDPLNGSTMKRAALTMWRSLAGRRPGAHDRSRKPLLVDHEAVYGIHAVTSALKARRRAGHKLLVDADVFAARGRGSERKRRHLHDCAAAALDAAIPVAHVPTAQLDSVAKSRPHQGVVLFCDPLPIHSSPTASVFSEPPPIGCPETPRLWMLLERITDVHNLGAMLRCALFFGVERVLLADCASPTAAVARASAGAVEWLPLHQVDKVVDTITTAQRCGWDVVGTDMLESRTVDTVTKASPAQESRGRGVPLHQFSVSRPTILCFGSEGSGLRRQTLNACTMAIGIPRRSILSEQSGVLYDLDSLNVSVSCGVILSALCR
eukprot:m.54167 g.54167  ORF g.54167 m.54167 type:complete len:337 (-) comp9184_c0_seq1:174-1184(-)